MTRACLPTSISLLASVVLLAGCASSEPEPTYVRSVSNSPAASPAADLWACRQETNAFRRSVSGRGLLGLMAHNREVERERTAMRECMEARGWVAQGVH